MNADLQTLRMVRGHLKQEHENASDDPMRSGAYALAIREQIEWVSEQIELAKDDLRAGLEAQQ